MGVLRITTTLAKYILLVFNFLILVCAITLIAFGGIILAKEDRGLKSFTEFSVGGFAIAIALIILIISFFGCYGAFRQDRCLLASYAGILIVLFILQIVLGALTLAIVEGDQKDFDRKIRNIVRDAFQGDYSNSDIVDDIQQKFHCCGVYGIDYWLVEMNLPKVPDSCCANYECNNPSTVFKTGCAEAFKTAIMSNIVVIGGVAIAFAIIELFGAGFALLVRSQIDPFSF